MITFFPSRYIKQPAAILKSINYLNKNPQRALINCVMTLLTLFAKDDRGRERERESKRTNEEKKNCDFCRDAARRVLP